MQTLPATNKKPSIITIGSFDGVHMGHQQLLSTLVATARKKDLQTVVITFWPHPAMFFKRVPERYVLTLPEERAELIKKCGINRVITLDFNQQLASLTAEQFLSILKEHTNFAHLLTGNDFALGKDRLGNLETLRELGKQLDFQLETIAPILDGSKVVSSSQVRQALINGKIREASKLLGRHFMLPGTVVHGENRGSKIGFPTANLLVAPERLIPGNGVYVTRAWLTGSDVMSVTNIGVRPTFENQLVEPRVEPHLLDTDTNLYEKEMMLEFIEFVRPEKKFNNSKDLARQIAKDIKFARKVFQHEE